MKFYIFEKFYLNLWKNMINKWNDAIHFSITTDEKDSISDKENSFNI